VIILSYSFLEFSFLAGWEPFIIAPTFYSIAVGNIKL
jgi:hypothetical protein